MARLQDACDGSPPSITQWGDWGFALEWVEDWAVAGWDEPNAWTTLLDQGGTELVQFGSSPGGAELVGAGPRGTVWNDELIEGPTGSSLLSLDGQQRTSVPGLDENEWVEQARWSPDGSRVALVVQSPQADSSLLRIVDAATGAGVAEVDDLGPVVQQTRWSSDGRYLLVGHDRDEYGAAGAALAVYDTATDEIAVERSFPELLDFRGIRTVEPTSVVVQFTPVAWDIALEESWGEGIFTIRMVVDAGPLLPGGIEGLSGRLVWADTIVDLCNIGIDEAGGGFVQFGDIFQTIEGCGTNPTAMQDAFDQFGLPESACLVIASGAADHEYCAPLS